MWIARALAKRGLVSRKEAQVVIRAGGVLLNGEVCVDPVVKVSDADVLELSGSARTAVDSKLTLVLNKPPGFISAHQDLHRQRLARTLLTRARCRPTPAALVGPGGLPPLPVKMHAERLPVCGRLDEGSSGLLVFSQCGVTAGRLIAQDSGVEKEYMVHVAVAGTEPGMSEGLRGGDSNRALLNLAGTPPRGLAPHPRGSWTLPPGTCAERNALDADAQRVATAARAAVLAALRSCNDLELGGGEPLRPPVAVDWVGTRRLRIVLRQGKKRQIRRMLALVGLHVVRLHRIRIGAVSLDALGLAEGEWCAVSKDAFFANAGDVATRSGASDIYRQRRRSRASPHGGDAPLPTRA